MSTPPNHIVFEQPLNERMRALLRLEHLFQRAEAQLLGEDVWSSRATLETLIDIMSVLGRADLKTELIKELERHAGTLEALERNPRVDVGRLGEILGRVRKLLARLRGIENAPGHELRNNELLCAVRQRSSIPAGTCDFDLPAYHYWLQLPAERRIEDLMAWLAAFDLLRNAIDLALTLVRESTAATREVAASGFFQRSLDSATPCQLLRVSIPAGLPLYPEISAGRHRFTVRFMQPVSAEARAAQTEQDVEFDLRCCVI